MKPRGRKSVAAQLICIDSARKRIGTPDAPAPEVEKICRELIASASPSHFVDTDKPLIVAYATALALSQHYAKQLALSDDSFKLWAEATKVAAMLATRLRLAPQSRLKAEAVARHEPARGKKPWEGSDAQKS